MPAETATNRSTQQTMERAEDTFTAIMDNSREAVLSMIEYNRTSLRTGFEFARSLQEESIRLTDAWFDHLARFQKSYIKSFHDYNSRFQDITEKTFTENGDRLEDAIEQSMELVTPGAVRTGAKRK